MKIADSSIQMGAVSTHSKTQATVESSHIWINPQPSTKENPFRWLQIDLSEEGKKLAENIQEVESTDASLFELSEKDKERIQLVSDFIYALTGKRIQFMIPKLHLNENSATGSSSISNHRNRFGISYRFTQVTHEEEHMAFETKGIVKTEDGREIHLDLKLNMDRTFTSYTDFSFHAGEKLVDPLVLNFDNPTASLGTKNYEFDLNADGKLDQISFVNAGSGFLAYDKNQNGIVDDGTELFGPSSGNGFLELRKYDEDGNGWIDENDDIYNNLSIWVREDDGEPKLMAFGQVGVGAIYLGHMETPFSLTDSNQNTQGKIRQSGAFLFENGEAGTIQHVDLAI